ncbi:MAG TPA: diaminopimelate decarboxylase, partial [Candidatus Kapabacteria bacterium]
MTDVIDQQAFHYSNNEEPKLLCEEVELSDLAREFGTPLYVYSKKQIIQNFCSFDETLKSSGKEHYVSYAVKANSNIELLKLLAEEGSGADVVSAGELLAALAAGFDPEKITFDGTGKTDAEIELALKANIHAFNVESIEEISVINEIAERLGSMSDRPIRAKVSIRVNPDVDAKSHPYISTGMKENKFGIDMENAREAFLYASKQPALEV